MHSEAEEMHSMLPASSSTVTEVLDFLKARAIDNLYKLSKKEEEFAVFLTEFQMMRSAQVDFFHAAKKAAAEKSSQNFQHRAECLIRAKNLEEKMDKWAVELLKRK